jgi:hypothetical protein
MRRASMLICLALLAMPLVTMAQTQLLIDPAKAPLTLKGGWIHHRTGARNDIVVKIESLRPDGSFTGKLDFYNSDPKAACKVMDGPLEEGKMTDTMLRVKAKAMNPNECPNFGLTFRTGGEKFLEGKTTRNDKIWLDAPK